MPVFPDDGPARCTPAESRALISYLTFRSGFSDKSKLPPPWDDLPDYVRDAILVAYHQGRLDGRAGQP